MGDTRAGMTWGILELAAWGILAGMTWGILELA